MHEVYWHYTDVLYSCFIKNAIFIRFAMQSPPPRWH